MIGALCAQFISDGLGRRRAFQVSAIIFIIGIMIMSMSVAYWMMLFGRVFVGLGVGFGLAVDPVYISEIRYVFILFDFIILRHFVRCVNFATCSILKFSVQHHIVVNL